MRRLYGLPFLSLGDDMVREEKDDKLTNADRAVMRLYEDTKETIEWDASDDAILSLSREIHEKDGAAQGKPHFGSDAEQEDGGEQDTGNVISFADRSRSFANRILHSPAMGFSLAASLMIGLFSGQAMIRYVDLGVSPGYDEVMRDNSRLQTELRDNRKLLTRSLNSSGSVTPRPGDSLLQLTQAISGFECASLSATLSKDMQVTVSGYVGSEADLRRLSGRLSPFDQSSKVINRTAVRTWPLCEVLEILPQPAKFSLDSRTLPMVQPVGHGPDFAENEKLIIEAQATPRYDGFLYVDFIQHDGRVLHMLPGSTMPDNAVKAGQRVLLGDGKQEYRIAPPFGTEMLVVLSSPEPLFEKARPQTEKAEGYFAALRAALARAHKRDFAEKILSNYYFIKTGSDRTGAKNGK